MIKKKVLNNLVQLRTKCTGLVIKLKSAEISSANTLKTNATTTNTAIIFFIKVPSFTKSVASSIKKKNK